MNKFLLAVIPGLVFNVAQAGGMVYVKPDGTWTENNGKIVKLAGTQGAQAVALSPQDGTLVYFVGAPLDYISQAETLRKGFISRPPYTSRTALPAPLNALDFYFQSFSWARDGSYVQAGEVRYDPELKKVWKTAEFRPRATSNSGAVSAWLAQYPALRVVGKTKAARTIFDPSKLSAALAVTQKTLQIDASAYNDPKNWWTGDPAVSPDGQAVYFSSNGGNGGGAAGNTDYVLLKLDTATDRIVALSRLRPKEGEVGSRLPTLQVSPDGKKLLEWTSVHVSAAENPSVLSVHDLPSAKSVFLDWEPVNSQPTNPPDSALTNWITAACWLDASTVALTAAMVRVPSFASESETNIDKPEYISAFSLYLFDAKTGKIKRTIPGVSHVSCG